MHAKTFTFIFDHEQLEVICLNGCTALDSHIYICDLSMVIALWLERAASSMGVVSSNPEACT